MSEKARFPDDLKLPASWDGIAQVEDGQEGERWICGECGQTSSHPPATPAKCIAAPCPWESFVPTSKLNEAEARVLDLEGRASELSSYNQTNIRANRELEARVESAEAQRDDAIEALRELVEALDGWAGEGDFSGTTKQEIAAGEKLTQARDEAHSLLDTVPTDTENN